MLYNFKNNGTEISLQPFYRMYKRNLWTIGLSVVLAGIAFFAPVYRDTQYILLTLAGMILLYFLYDYFFKVHVTIVFDKHTRTIYKKVFFIKIPLYKFENADVVTTNIQCSGFYYGLANKKNRYGKNQAISDYMEDNSKGQLERQQFENEILPEIEKMINT